MVQKDFSERVYAVVSKVPKGKVTTYKAVAHALGCKAYRAVGTALNRNPYAPVVPCHRVVNANGNIGGFAHGSRRKKEMLAKEGVRFNGGKIKDFEKVLFKL